MPACVWWLQTACEGRCCDCTRSEPRRCERRASFLTFPQIQSVAVENNLSTGLRSLGAAFRLSAPQTSAKAVGQVCSLITRLGRGRARLTRRWPACFSSSAESCDPLNGFNWDGGAAGQRVSSHVSHAGLGHGYVSEAREDTGRAVGPFGPRIVVLEPRSHDWVVLSHVFTRF